jgi:hypothetical protein
VQDKAYHFFIEVEGQGVELEQISTATEQCLKGNVSDAIIQEFGEQDLVA